MSISALSLQLERNELPFPLKIQGCSMFTLHHVLSPNSRGLHVCPLFSPTLISLLVLHSYLKRLSSISR